MPQCKHEKEADENRIIGRPCGVFALQRPQPLSLGCAGRAESGDVLSPSVAGLDADKGGAAAAGTDGGARASGRELSEAQMYQGMAGRMEIISPGDVTLAKFLGSGGYGEARRPRVTPSMSPRLWNSAEGRAVAEH